MNTNLYWSFHTGEFFYVADDEIQTLNGFSVSLTKKPKLNCKRCFGRFHEGKNINTGLYIPCQKCRKTCIDYEKLLGDMEQAIKV